MKRLLQWKCEKTLLTRGKDPRKGDTYGYDKFGAVRR